MITELCGTPVDHSFLRYKFELTAYGYLVGKISTKLKQIDLHKASPADN